MAFSSSLDAATAQILDKLADLGQGPFVGTLLATAASGTVVVPQGTLARLPDTRLVRVRKSTRVGTTATPVPCRPLYLAPAIPAVGNFAPIGAGLVAAWVAPPAGLAATATTTAFGPGALGTGYGLRLASVAYYDRPSPRFDELFAAGEAGTVSACIYLPQLRYVPGGGLRHRRALMEATWTLRVAIASWQGTKDKILGITPMLDALADALIGARVGSGSVHIQSFRRMGDGLLVYEAQLTGSLWLTGRAFAQPGVTPQKLATVGILVEGSDFGLAANPFLVQQDLATP